MVPAIRLAGLGLLLALIAVAVPVDAGAKTSQFDHVINASPYEGPWLFTNNGYALDLHIGSKSSGSKASLAIHNGFSYATHHSSATYTVKGESTEKVGAATFPGFGKIRIRFRPWKGESYRLRLPPGCTGSPGLIQVGEYFGRIRFAGEGNWTRINARAKKSRKYSEGWYGYRVAGHRVKCPPNVIPSYDPRLGVVGLVGGTDDPAGPSFTAIREPYEHAPTRFRAGLTETIGNVKVQREVKTSWEPAYRFSFPGDLTTAKLWPPMPFAGTGNYVAATGEWTGDLRVSFLGRPGIPLVGDGIAVNSFGPYSGPSLDADLQPAAALKEVAR